jgi:hypothetical protein
MNNEDTSKELVGRTATHEQFHSELMTDMDLERLPSGKFDTNFLMCQLACAALSLLRLIDPPCRALGTGPGCQRSRIFSV